MLETMKNITNGTYTENGAYTYKSTGSECLDLFATIGALRGNDETVIANKFMRAYCENADLAMKILFFARDIRGGLGERRTFRTILNYLATFAPASVIRNIENIAEYGRFDDLLCLFDTPCEKDMLAYVKKQFERDMSLFNEGKPVSLLAKWLPSVNTSSKDAVAKGKRVAKALGMSMADYRKALSALRAQIKIIENNLREKDYTFDYEVQPSGAMHKYRKAFFRNDGDRYNSYLDAVNNGSAKMNTGTLAPYQIINSALHSCTIEERKALDTAWRALEDFTNDENSIAVVDGSASMYSCWFGNVPPITVALSLGIYFAERNKGAFKNRFITFSENPSLVEIKGGNIFDKVKYCASFDEVANTNIQKVFELILMAAITKKASKNELPKKIYIISDMEFDSCTEDAKITNFEYAKNLFEKYGYTLPEIVFWNVNSRTEQHPVKKNEQGVALVSGFTPRLFSMVTSEEFSPEKLMLDIITSERYAAISA